MTFFFLIMLCNCLSDSLFEEKKRKGCLLFPFPRGHKFYMFLFWTCLLDLCKYICPSFLCFLAKGNMQGGSHKVVKLSPNEVFCFIFLAVLCVDLLYFFFLSLSSLPTWSWCTHKLAPNPSTVLFSGFVSSCFMPMTLGAAWLPDQVVCSCPAASAASSAACRRALPAQPLHTLLCRQMCSSAFWVAELETKWTEVGNVCIQLWRSMVLFSQFYCSDTLINTSRFPFLLFLLC